MREQPRCKSCRFFDEVCEQKGLCKVSPPLSNPDGNGIWPMVPDHEWCGSHRPFFKVVNTPLGARMAPVDKDDE